MQAREHGHEICGWRNWGSWCRGCRCSRWRLHKTGSSQGCNKITTQLRCSCRNRLGLNAMQLCVGCLLKRWNRFADLRCARLLRILEQSRKRAQLLWVERRHGRRLLWERGRCRRRLREWCRRLKGERRRLCWRLPLRRRANRRRGGGLRCRGYGKLSYLSSDCLQRLRCNLLRV